jgi:hypothetical protein
LGLLAALVLCLFLVLLLTRYFIPTVSEAVAKRDQLPQVARELETLEEDLEQLRSKAAEAQSRTNASLQGEISRKRSDLADARKKEDDVCGIVKKAIDVLTPGNACKTAQKVVKELDEAVKTLERGLGQTEDVFVKIEIANKEKELGRKKAEEEDLQKSQATVLGRVLDQWAQTWKWLVAFALLVIFTPYALRTVSYFLLMPMVSRVHKPIHLAAGREHATADLRTAAAQRTLTIQLSAGEVLSARSEHVRPVQGTIRSRLLYDWTSPFISFAAGLHGLSRVTGDAGGSSATLATPDDPDSYLMRIDFTDHPGVVMHPKHVVGVIGTPDLETRWRWGIQSFATWQVRYIMFAGTGSLIVQGSGDVVATSPPGRPEKMDQHLVMGFDSRLTRGVTRTEVFVPYLRGKTPLVDDEFTGCHPFFWQKSSADGPNKPITRTFSAVFSALGKLFGF